MNNTKALAAFESKEAPRAGVSWDMEREQTDQQCIQVETAEVARNETSSSYLSGLFPRGPEVVGRRYATSRCGEKRGKRIVGMVTHLTYDNAFRESRCGLLAGKASD